MTPRRSRGARYGATFGARSAALVAVGSPDQVAAASRPKAAVPATPATAVPVVMVRSRSIARPRRPMWMRGSLLMAGVSPGEPFGSVTPALGSTRSPSVPRRPVRRPPSSGRRSPGRSRRRSRGPGRPHPGCRCARWKRSKIRVRSVSGMPGPLSSTVSRPAPPSTATADVDPAAVRRVLAGVVEQHAEQPVEPLRRRDDHGARPVARPRAIVRCRASAIGPNRSTACAAMIARSTGSAFGGRASRRSGRATAGPRAAGASASTRGRPARRPRDTSAASRSCGEGEAGVGLDDRERRPQLVRGVGGEVQLALAGALDRRGDTPADRDGAEEHGDEQDRRDQQLRQDDRRARLDHRLERLADDDPVVADLAAGDPRSAPSIVAVVGPTTVCVLGGKGRVRRVASGRRRRLRPARGAAVQPPRPVRRRRVVRATVGRPVMRGSGTNDEVSRWSICVGQVPRGRSATTAIETAR